MDRRGKSQIAHQANNDVEKTSLEEINANRIHTIVIALHLGLSIDLYFNSIAESDCVISHGEFTFTIQFPFGEFLVQSSAGLSANHQDFPKKPLSPHSVVRISLTRNQLTSHGLQNGSSGLNANSRL